MENAKDTIIKNLNQILSSINIEEKVDLDTSGNIKNGDYSTSIALKASKKLGKNPRDVAEELKSAYEKLNDLNIQKIEVAGPGFLNFFLSNNQFIQTLADINAQKDSFGHGKSLDGKKIMVEFAHPNTHKEFHIGHMRNITTGESISRILESQSAHVSRVNYQGDVGMHVAKALYGVQKLDLDLEATDKLNGAQKAEILGKAYALGSKFYEEDEAAKKEIGTINKQIYAKEEPIYALWKKTRSWSLEYFDTVYKRVNTKFDRFFFESEVYEKGKETVLKHVSDGVFTENDGAVVFEGKKYGLHTRVFVTGEGNPTYEGKEMGLGPLQYSEFKFDQAVHVVGPEQAGYFEVVFKALELVDPVFVGREKHLSYGFVHLKDGKMSSRMGNIVRGEWLLDEAKDKILKSFPTINEETAESVAVGAVKYSMLRVGRTSDIQFSFDESISLEGNSGPYIQYTFVRTQSVLNKAGGAIEDVDPDVSLNEEELSILKHLKHFPEVVAEAAELYAPSTIATYLFELTQKFNLFYQKHSILEAESDISKNFRLSLVHATGQVIKNGLYLLGISTVEKM